MAKRSKPLRWPTAGQRGGCREGSAPPPNIILFSLLFSPAQARDMTREGGSPPDTIIHYYNNNNNNNRLIELMMMLMISYIYNIILLLISTFIRGL